MSSSEYSNGNIHSEIAESIRGACPHDCPDTCSFFVTVENGRAVKIEGAKDHPTTDGFLCTKVNRYLERTYSPQRVLYPMKRAGEKGSGIFERISWDEALDTIAAKFKEIAADDPQAILPYSYAGTMGFVQSQSIDRRFFHRLGASLLARTICADAGAAGYRATIGLSMGTDPERFSDAKLIIIWGSNVITSNVHLWPKILEAKRKGAKVIAIDPYRSLTAEKCDEHLAVIAGRGRRAGAGDDERDRQRESGRSRLRRTPHARLRSVARTRDGIPAVARRRDYGT